MVCLGKSTTIKSNWQVRRKGKTILYPLESYGSINRRPATTRFHLLTNSHIHMTDVGKFNVSCLYIWNLCPPPCFSLEMASVGGSSGALIHSLLHLPCPPSPSSHPFTLATLHLVPAILLPFPFPLLSCLTVSAYFSSTVESETQWVTFLRFFRLHWPCTFDTFTL